MLLSELVLFSLSLLSLLLLLFVDAATKVTQVELLPKPSNEWWRFPQRKKTFLKVVGVLFSDTFEKNTFC